MSSLRLPSALVAMGFLATAAVPATRSGPAPPIPVPPIRATFTDWPTYHLDAARTGYDPNTPPIGTLSMAWTATLDGAVYAEPLVVGGRVIAATENDTVYALDPSTGTTLWRRHLGTPVPLNQLPCGVDPLGITGSPVYDPGSGRIFVAAERLSGTGAVQHALVALDPASGAVVGARVIDPSGSIPTVEQQGAALAVGNGVVYVAFGALSGDCGAYLGYVVGSLTNLTGGLAVYSAQKYVPSAGRGGIWGTSGPAVDPSGNLFVAVGNGSSTTAYDLSDSILKLGPGLRLRDFFAPSTWAQDNAHDADLGSTGPALVPGGYVYADGKSGTGYLLDQSHLGHIGGQIASASVCASYGGTALLGTTVFVPCTDGIRAVDVGGGTIQVKWHASATSAKGPSVVGGGAVWSLGISNGVLYAINPSTGATISSLSVGAVEHFASPTLSGGLVFVPVSTGVVAVSGA